jgi:hypothetical protein
MSHPVYPGGPPCQPSCPGEWSTYHDGYADGFEAGERNAKGRPEGQPSAEATPRVVSEPPEHITDAGDCWCQPTALKTVEGDYIFVHKEVVQ